MLVRCNKRHLCRKIKYSFCTHAQWHEHTPSCTELCVTLRLMNLNQTDMDCIEQEQEEFITKEDMVICQIINIQ